MDHYQYDPESQNDNHFNNNDNNNNRPERSDKIAIASLICGIIAIPGVFTVWLGIIFGFAAIALAIISRLNNGKFEGYAIPGLTLGIIFVIISLMLFALVLIILSNPESTNSLIKYMESIK